MIKVWKLASCQPEMALFRNLGVNLRDRLGDVPTSVSAHSLDFLDLAKKCSFLNWKLTPVPSVVRFISGWALATLRNWNTGHEVKLALMVECWVLAKWVIGLLAKPLLTGESTNDILSLKANIAHSFTSCPTFPACQRLAEDTVSMPACVAMAGRHHSGTRQKPEPQKTLYIQ